ncbi:MAG: twin-arginine translocase subunit TatC [Candidatus Pacebacteria bacterium]|nr:twin-arginine translocase subunit TatC [Candidatus Paceibacterota bacterium]
MTILEEFKEFIKHILSSIYLMLIFSFLFFIVPIKDGYSFTVLVFRQMEFDFLPSGVALIVTNPMSAFVSQVMISLLLAFIITFPFFLFKIIKYLTPALFAHEKKIILKFLIPANLLFLGGCIFSYTLLVPITFKALYPFTVALGAIPFFAVNEFISYVLGLLIATGVIFLLPLFMILLSYAHIVPPIFWRTKSKYFLFSFLIFSALITPDGTGITMILLFLPMMCLYLLGSFLTGKLDKSKVNL